MEVRSMSDLSRFRSALSGVGVTPATPFTEDLSRPDLAALIENLTFLVDEGVRLLYVAGNSGEVASLSADEWTAVVETAVETVGDRAVVAAGVGHEYPVAIELARRAAELGVAGILAMPRQQPYVASAGLVDYWQTIIEHAGLPAVVYSRGLPEANDLARLLDHELVVGCKYSNRDISGFANTVADDQSGVAWTCGIAERYAPFFYMAGAVGFTSGLANFAPRIALGLHAALAEGDWKQALELRAACVPIEEIRARRGDAYNVGAVKVGLDAVGLTGGGVRPPLAVLDPESAAEAAAEARRLHDYAEVAE
jgi:4-hydroxy-tetrahydrodipicolinate synthase